MKLKIHGFSFLAVNLEICDPVLQTPETRLILLDKVSG